jgi:hypothetical protein
MESDLFISEYPEIGELLHCLLVNRELDEWYKNKCAENTIIRRIRISNLECG